MHSLLHQLENNEAILLMYLADELSAEDRAEVEQMLSGDPSMRAELDRLRATRDDTFSGLASLDAHGRLPVAEGVAVRRAARTIRQWQIDQAQAPPPEEPVNELRFPWWSYPLTTAAVVMIAFLVWWGNRPEPTSRSAGYQVQEEIAGPVNMEDWRAEALAAELQESFEVSDEELFRMAQVEELKSLASSNPAGAGPANDL